MFDVCICVKIIGKYQIGSFKVISNYTTTEL